MRTQAQQCAKIQCMSRRPRYTLEVFGDKDEITVQELYDFFGKNPENNPQDEQWMRNRVYFWQSSDLILNIYETINNKRCLTKIRLTERGKAKLGRGGENSLGTTGSLAVSETQSGTGNDYRLPADLLVLASKWVKDNPERQVTFKLEPTEGVSCCEVTLSNSGES